MSIRLVQSELQKMSLVLVVSALVFVGGCSSAKKVEDEGGGVPAAADATDNTLQGDSDTGRAMGLQTVHFPYDASVLDSEGKAILQSNADILKGKMSLKIQIEGHCDQRGGIQYNIALGERRANAVRKYLQGKGVAGDRMTVISFGKEKPVDSGTGDEAYAKNRRANFVITSQ